MKTIKLFVKFAFTSLSPDAQPISLGITSNNDKTFYAEFTDFDINRCDDWVKKNVISKLEFNKRFSDDWCDNGDHLRRKLMGNIDNTSTSLREWLDLQFKDFNIQFVVDCSYLSSMWIIDLLDERLSCPGVALIPESVIPSNMTASDFVAELRRTWGNVILQESNDKIEWVKGYKQGLPILPKNICPIVEDLNTLVAYSEGISVKDAFETDRQALAWNPVLYNQQKYNALFDAEVIKTIYNDLTR